MKLDRFRARAETPLFSLTAMIDVLFLMIIFLVLGANFDSIASVDLPRAEGGESRAGTVRVVLPMGGGLVLDGRNLDAAQAVQALRARQPRSILLLPDRDISVDALFRWYDLLGRRLGVPVSVGVQPPR